MYNACMWQAASTTVKLVGVDVGREKDVDAEEVAEWSAVLVGGVQS